MDGFLLTDVERTAFAPFGLNGGMAGMPGAVKVNPGTPEEKHIQFSHEAIPVQAGDRIRILTGGGGGWGDPLKRDTEAVRLDVARRIVSRQSGEQNYGVVLEEVEDQTRVYEVDEEATKERRAEIEASRRPLRLIDRGEYAERLIDEGRISVCDLDLPAFATSDSDS